MKKLRTDNSVYSITINEITMLALKAYTAHRTRSKAYLALGARPKAEFTGAPLAPKSVHITSHTADCRKEDFLRTALAQRLSFCASRSHWLLDPKTDFLRTALAPGRIFCA